MAPRLARTGTHVYQVIGRAEVQVVLVLKKRPPGYCRRHAASAVASAAISATSCSVRPGPSLVEDVEWLTRPGSLVLVIRRTSNSPPGASGRAGRGDR